MATLAQESFDILTLLPTYIENTKDAIATLSKDSKVTQWVIITSLGSGSQPLLRGPQVLLEIVEILNI